MQRIYRRTDIRSTDAFEYLCVRRQVSFACSASAKYVREQWVCAGCVRNIWTCTEIDDCCTWERSTTGDSGSDDSNLSVRLMMPRYERYWRRDANKSLYLYDGETMQGAYPDHCP